MRAGSWFSGDRAVVSKSITNWYWPEWKALWMLMSSRQRMSGMDGRGVRYSQLTALC